jgi:hypothetical protein
MMVSTCEAFVNVLAEERRVSLSVPFVGRLGAWAIPFTRQRQSMTSTNKSLFIQLDLIVSKWYYLINNGEL